MTPSSLFSRARQAEARGLDVRRLASPEAQQDPQSHSMSIGCAGLCERSVPHTPPCAYPSLPGPAHSPNSAEVFILSANTASDRLVLFCRLEP